MLEGVYQSFGYPPNGAPHLPPPPVPPTSSYPDNPVEPQVQPYGGLSYRDPYPYRTATGNNNNSNSNNNNSNSNSNNNYYAYQSPTSSASSLANHEAPSPVFPDHRTSNTHPNSDPNNYYAPPPSSTSTASNGWQTRSSPSSLPATTQQQQQQQQATAGFPWSDSTSPSARPYPSAGGGYIGARTGGDINMTSPTKHHHHHYHHHPISPPGFGPPASLSRPKLTTTVWEDEGTVCYQVDAKGICVARRADNEMINGTKLLNVVGMSRGKRDGILKNEKDRVVIKVGAMHLKGVWITLRRAKYLATKFRICDILYPLFEDDPKKFVYATSPPNHPAAAAAGVSSPPASVSSSRRASSLLDNSPDSLSSGMRSSPFNDNTKRSSLPSMSTLDQGIYIYMMMI
ncbi:hypothetical protein BDA99DRAFT_328127 [Phascolomyces articulosus]|uniref:HTH APSES-type domain-containing protein n=1 Tax=Phascolomyces articulosus TaxID=60185 RepID=A0AAD5KM31_9FUNG|nr:hypothetical protein BDA99DRAFT_328127 [Phascolomyces articulosus]